MKIGAVYPQYELGGDPAAVAAFGVGAERMGFDHLVCYDHVVGSPPDRVPPLTGPYTHEHPFHDPFVLFAYLAGLTERIEFVTGVLVLPQRQTVLVARQAADIQLLSGGRLRLGVAPGWNWVEYAALGQEFTTRGTRMAEQIRLLRRLWTGEIVDFEGSFDRVDGAALNPPPAWPIPIWIGGSSSRALKRAARLAEGFIFHGPRESWEPLAEQLRTALREEGRDVEGFGFELIARGPGAGSVVDAIEAWAEAGGTHAAVTTMLSGLPADVGAHTDMLAEVRQELDARGLWSS